MVAKIEKNFELRNKNMINARAMMSDRKEAERLAVDEPKKTFGELVAYKKAEYNLAGDDAYLDIIRSSQTTRKSVNKILRLE